MGTVVPQPWQVRDVVYVVVGGGVEDVEKEEAVELVGLERWERREGGGEREEVEPPVLGEPFGVPFPGLPV